MATSATKSAAATVTAPQSIGNTMRRLVSLDVARGITIAFMILVNNGGSGQYSYHQLQHSAWNGWTLTDLVFPSFLFIAGISIVLSTETRLARGESKTTLRLHVLRRSVILFLLGLLVNSVPLLDPNQNWVAYLDRKLLSGHLYEGVRDPEGLLSDIPAMGTILFGVLTGIWLRRPKSLSTKAAGLLGAAISGLVLGEIWNVWFPINKKLWTSSYVLFAAGCTLLLLSICFYAVEIKKWTRGWTFPWLVFGSNAITAYVFSELLAAGIDTVSVHDGARVTSLQQFIYQHFFFPLINPSFGSLLYSISFVLVCFIPVVLMYRKKVFIKI